MTIQKNNRATGIELAIRSIQDACWYAHEGDMEAAKFFGDQAFLLIDVSDPNYFDVLRTLEVTALLENIKYMVDQHTSQPTS